MDPKARGILNLRTGRQHWRNQLYPPSPELADLVEHYWMVRWDIRDREPYTQHTLSNPSVHLVIERGRSRIQGVVTGRFTRVLEGTGRVFGVKFRPAGFRPFLGSAVSALTDRTVPVSRVFGSDGDSLVDHVLAQQDVTQMVNLADGFIRDRLPAPDARVPLVNGIVARMLAEREITTVEQVVDRARLGKRVLQRLFREYVGVSPKWVIRRYRLYEAAERLANGEEVDLATLALDLGYFDQPHFARDFKSVVGKAPATYAQGASQATVAHRASRTDWPG